jgi:RNA recognition motif-containing protein
MVDWTTPIPTEPTPTLVHVKNLSLNTSEKTAKDFFEFCGKIKSFEIQPSADGKHREALILFERESAAKTAVLLSNALIDESHITVESYFPTSGEPKKEHAVDDTTQEAKPKSNIMAEILASGYVLTDNVIAKGIEFDSKYAFTKRIQDYLQKLTTTAQQLDEKYKVSDKATEVDSKYNIQQRTKTTAETAQNKAQEFLHSETGQKVQTFADHIMKQVAAVHNEALRIAEDKKGSPVAFATCTSSAPTATSGSHPETAANPEKRAL